MAHVIDFTLFYGGIASAPTAELPFSGSSFDVQAGAARRAYFGRLEVESVAEVSFLTIPARIAGVGLPSVNYQALLDGVGGVGSAANFGTVSITTEVELGGVTVGKHVEDAGSVYVETSSIVITDGFYRRATPGEPTISTGIELDVEPVARQSVFGTATARTAVTLTADSAGAGADFGSIAVSTGVELTGITSGGHSALIGKPEVYVSCIAALDTVQVAGAEFGLLQAVPAVMVTLAGIVQSESFGAVQVYSTALTQPAGISTVTSVVNSALVESGLALSVEGIARGKESLGVLTVTYGALVEPHGIESGAVFGSVLIETEVFPAGVARDVWLGAVDAYSVFTVFAVSVVDTSSAVNDAHVLSAVTLDMGGCVHKAPEFGIVDVWNTARAELVSVERRAVLGKPSIFIEVFPESLFANRIFGDATFYSERSVEPASIPPREWEMGDTEFYSAVTLDAVSVEPDESRIGKPEINTIVYVGVRGFDHGSVFGKPAIDVEVFPASVARGALVEDAIFVSVRHTYPASVPSIASVTGYLAIEGVAWVRAEGLNVASRVMGAGISTETTALIQSRSAFTGAAFGRPDIALVVMPDSLMHECACGDIALIPAHTVDAEALSRVAGLGVPDVGFGLLVVPAGIPSRSKACGKMDVAWRKCVRWDILVELAKERDVRAVIRPAPKRVERWQGAGCVKREDVAEAVIQRWFIIHSVVKSKNSFTAIVNKDE